MATLKEIKSHIKSVTDTQKITNAMYLISSTKLKSTKNQFANFVSYFNDLELEMQNIAKGISADECEYMESKSGSIGFLIIASDKGLCGDFNKSVIRKAEKEISNHPDCKIYLIGEVLKKYFTSKDIKFENNFDFEIKSPNTEIAQKISDFFCKEFTEGKLSKVIAIYADTTDGTESTVISKQILPIGSVDGKADENVEFFPSQAQVLDNIIPMYLVGVFYSIILQSFVSEHNARMIAMDAANNNAKELIDSLTLQYNHLRQNAITQEITEISSGRKQK